MRCWRSCRSCWRPIPSWSPISSATTGSSSATTTLRRQYERDNAARPDVLARTRFYGALAARGGARALRRVRHFRRAVQIRILRPHLHRGDVLRQAGRSPTTSAARRRLISNGVDGLLAPAGAPHELAACHRPAGRGPRLARELGPQRAARPTRPTTPRTLMIDRLEAYYRARAGGQERAALPQARTACGREGCLDLR